MTTNFNNVSYADTGEYYKNRAWDYAYQYNLPYNSYPESGHNDAVDAFRHTFMETMFTYKYNSDISKIIGNTHETLNPNKLNESNMDHWNNYVGRKIGENLKNDPNTSGMTDKQLEDYAAQKVYEAYLNGDLITDPNDKSQYEDHFDNNPDYEDLLHPTKRDLQNVDDDFSKAKNTNPVRIDPLLVDLDGDGIETTTLQNGVYFDHDKNGFAQQSAWVGADDGVLAIDKNNDGVINDGGEIFGDNYVLSNNQTATTGFQALADLDSNSDGVINSSDTNFSNIKVLKGDGTLETLAEAGIASINLNYSNTNAADASGNTQLRLGSYTKTDSTTAAIGDYSFTQNAMYSVATDWVEVSTAIAELPDITGYGTAYSLHQAMAKRLRIAA